MIILTFSKFMFDYLSSALVNDDFWFEDKS